MKVSGKVVAEGALKSLDEMVQQPKWFSGWANTKLLRLHANFQKSRWISEGAVAGLPRWRPLSPAYAAHKRRRYGGGPKFVFEPQGPGKNPWVQSGVWPTYPGGGRKVLMATGRLLRSMLAPRERGSIQGNSSGPEEFRKIVTDKKVIFSSSVPYAERVDQERPFSDYPPSIIKEMASSYAKYLVAGVMRR